MLAVGLLRFINSVIGAVGSLLLFLGIFELAARGELDWVIWGMALTVLCEATNLYLTRFDSKKQIDSFVASFWTNLGTTYALPVLFFVLYLSAADKFMLVFTLSITAGAVVKTAAMLLKMKYIENLGQV
jgi:hypothetical protein